MLPPIHKKFQSLKIKLLRICLKICPEIWCQCGTDEFQNNSNNNNIAFEEYNFVGKACRTES